MCYSVPLQRCLQDRLSNICDLFFYSAFVHTPCADITSAPARIPGSRKIKSQLFHKVASCRVFAVLMSPVKTSSSQHDSLSSQQTEIAGVVPYLTRLSFHREARLMWGAVNFSSRYPPSFICIASSWKSMLNRCNLTKANLHTPCFLVLLLRHYLTFCR